MRPFAVALLACLLALTVVGAIAEDNLVSYWGAPQSTGALATLPRAMIIAPPLLASGRVAAPPISTVASRPSRTQNPIVPLMPGGPVLTLDGAPQGSGIASSGQQRPGEAAVAPAPGAAAAATAASTSGTEAQSRVEHAKARFRAGADDDDEEEEEEGGARQQRKKKVKKGAAKPQKAQAKKAQPKKAQVGEAKAKAKAKPAKKGPKYPPYQDFITRLAAVLKPPADFNRGKSKVQCLRIRDARMQQVQRPPANESLTRSPMLHGRAGWQPSSARTNAKHNLP
jgi:hypothetical protein